MYDKSSYQNIQTLYWGISELKITNLFYFTWFKYSLFFYLLHRYWQLKIESTQLFRQIFLPQSPRQKRDWEINYFFNFSINVLDIHIFVHNLKGSNAIFHRWFNEYIIPMANGDGTLHMLVSSFHILWMGVSFCWSYMNLKSVSKMTHFWWT